MHLADPQLNLLFQSRIPINREETKDGILLYVQ